MKRDYTMHLTHFQEHFGIGISCTNKAGAVWRHAVRIDHPLESDGATPTEIAAGLRMLAAWLDTNQKKLT